MKIKDIMPADRFGRWTVLSSDQHLNGKKRLYCYCVCDCGNTAFISRDNLTGGKSTSCGKCRYKTVPINPLSRGIYNTRIHNIWSGMIDRCYNPNISQYKRYGARGITVCDEWRHDAGAFYNWAVTHGYSDELSIDRIDNDKGYSPDNCRWATHEEQQNNRRVNRNLTFNGKTQSVTQWAREIGVGKSTLFHRLDKMSVEEALTMPLVKSKSSKYRKEVASYG